MADNKQKAPKPHKTPKEKAQESYKVHKEYRKLERRDRLPQFVITIICFLIIIGLFMGLYTEFDFLVDLNPREFSNFNVSAASTAIGSKVKLAFVNFFNALNSVSRVSSKLVNTFTISGDYSENDDLNTFLIDLNSTGVSYLNIHYPLIEHNSRKKFLDNYLTCLADVDTIKIFSGYIYPGEMHYAFVHKNDLQGICDIYGWHYATVALKFEEFELCYLDVDGNMHCFCEYGEGWFE